MLLRQSSAYQYVPVMSRFLLLPVSRGVVRCFYKVSTLYWLQKIGPEVAYFIRVHFWTKCYLAFVLFLTLKVRELPLQLIAVSTTTCLDNNLILSFCGNLLFRSVFLSTVTLFRLLIQYFRLSYMSPYTLFKFHINSSTFWVHFSQQQNMRASFIT